MKALFHGGEYDIPDGYMLKTGVDYGKDIERYLWNPQPSDLFYHPPTKLIGEYIKWQSLSPSGNCSLDGCGVYKQLAKRKIFYANNIEIRKCIPIQVV